MDMKPKDRAEAEAESRARHPAGKHRVPQGDILRRLMAILSENHWFYGSPTTNAPNRVERWDVRSLLDYAILSMPRAADAPYLTYPIFYLWRNQVMETLMASINDIRPPGTDLLVTYGDWRYWETEAERSYTDIDRVVRHALKFVRD